MFRPQIIDIMRQCVAFTLSLCFYFHMNFANSISIPKPTEVLINRISSKSKQIASTNSHHYASRFVIVAVDLTRKRQLLSLFSSNEKGQVRKECEVFLKPRLPQVFDQRDKSRLQGLVLRRGNKRPKGAFQTGSDFGNAPILLQKSNSGRYQRSKSSIRNHIGGKVVISKVHPKKFPTLPSIKRKCLDFIRKRIRLQDFVAYSHTKCKALLRDRRQKWNRLREIFGHFPTLSRPKGNRIKIFGYPFRATHPLGLRSTLIRRNKFGKDHPVLILSCPRRRRAYRNRVQAINTNQNTTTNDKRTTSSRVKRVVNKHFKLNKRETKKPKEPKEPEEQKAPKISKPKESKKYKKKNSIDLGLFPLSDDGDSVTPSPFAENWKKMKDDLTKMQREIITTQIEYTKVEEKVKMLMREGDQLANDLYHRQELSETDTAIEKDSLKKLKAARDLFEKKLTQEEEKRDRIKKEFESAGSAAEKVETMRKEVEKERDKMLGEESVENYLGLQLLYPLKGEDTGPLKESDLAKMNRTERKDKLLRSDIAIVMNKDTAEDKELKEMDNMLSKILNRRIRDVHVAAKEDVNREGASVMPLMRRQRSLESLDIEPSETLRMRPGDGKEKDISSFEKNSGTNEYVKMHEIDALSKIPDIAVPNYELVKPGGGSMDGLWRGDNELLDLETSKDKMQGIDAAAKFPGIVGPNYEVEKPGGGSKDGEWRGDRNVAFLPGKRSSDDLRLEARKEVLKELGLDGQNSSTTKQKEEIQTWNMNTLGRDWGGNGERPYLDKNVANVKGPNTYALPDENGRYAFPNPAVLAQKMGPVNALGRNWGGNGERPYLDKNVINVKGPNTYAFPAENGRYAYNNPAVVAQKMGPVNALGRNWGGNGERPYLDKNVINVKGPTYALPAENGRHAYPNPAVVAKKIPVNSLGRDWGGNRERPYLDKNVINVKGPNTNDLPPENGRYAYPNPAVVAQKMEHANVLEPDRDDNQQNLHLAKNVVNFKDSNTHALPPKNIKDPRSKQAMIARENKEMNEIDKTLQQMMKDVAFLQSVHSKSKDRMKAKRKKDGQELEQELKLLLAEASTDVKDLESNRETINHSEPKEDDDGIKAVRKELSILRDKSRKLPTPIKTNESPKIEEPMKHTTPKDDYFNRLLESI